jgi:hypothetical protein
MTLAAKKATAESQWTGPIIDIEEYCYGVVHPVTRQTITHYRKLMNDPHLKDLWVPAMSKEIHRLAQGKPGVTKATNTIFFLTHSEIRHIPSNQTVTYVRIVINHRPQKEDPNHIRITVGGNLISYPLSSPHEPPTLSCPSFFGTAQSVHLMHDLVEPTSRICILKRHSTATNT